MNDVCIILDENKVRRLQAARKRCKPDKAKYDHIENHARVAIIQALDCIVDQAIDVQMANVKLTTTERKAAVKRTKGIWHF